MRGKLVWAAVIAVTLAVAAATLAQGQDNKYRLKPGAAGKVCLDCHPDFGSKLKSRFVHTPVKSGDCAGCHSPHTSDHGKLLAAAPNAVCATCHGSMVPATTASAHKVVVEGNCVKCHDPHGSATKGNLLQAGNDLCMSCHKATGDAIAKVKFKHRPVSDGCLGCHDPHASQKAPHLLKAAVPALCLQCHKADSPSFLRQHGNYPVARADCTSCHDAHGSNTAGLLFDTVHPPVAAKRCTQCHGAATAAEPFATRRTGFELCRGCHSTMMNETFAKSRLHWPVAGKTGCLSCHEAHASRQKKLLNAGESTVCGRCHQDTLSWQAKLAATEKEQRAAAKGRVEKGVLAHAPVQDGSCTSCHVPHASDNANLMRQASAIQTCGSCHDWLKHSSHPMGDKYADMRSRNRPVDCLSCHRSHGTGYRYMLTLPSSSDLCVQCHKALRR